MTTSATHTKIRNSIGSQTHSETYKQVANKALRFLISVVQARGLGVQQLQDKYDTFEQRMLSWLPSSQPFVFVVEVYDGNKPKDERVLERIDVHFDIQDPADPNTQQRQAGENQDSEDNVDAIIRRINDLDPLPTAANYQIHLRKARQDVWEPIDRSGGGDE